MTSRKSAQRSIALLLGTSLAAMAAPAFAQGAAANDGAQLDEIVVTA
ncbi:MAG: hypothetical protein RL764_483, partial [Pseudomonadota bacterium]